MTKIIPAPSLKALAEAKTIGVSKKTIFGIDPDLVVIEEGWNGRDDTPELQAYRQRMKQAMKLGAFIPPIDIQMVDGQAIVRDGHSRTLMARELKAEGVDYVLQAREIRGNDAEMRLHMLGSGQGHQWSPLEMGRQFLILTRQGLTVAQIADRLGQHRSTVENGLKLAEMPTAVQSMVAKGEVASHTALKTVKEHGTKATGVLSAAVKEAKAAGKKKATPKAIAKTSKPPRKVKGTPAPLATDMPAPAFMTLREGKIVDAPTVQALHDICQRLATATTADKLALAQLAAEARQLLGI